MTTIQTPPKKVDIGLRSLASNAAEDLIGGLQRTDLWGRMGWLDVKRRYQRTKVGPFWSSLTLAIYVLAVGSVGAGLWQQDFRVYFPYLTSGMLVWTLLSVIITESCTLFVQGHALFRNVRFEYSILAYALVWRNCLVFFHNFLVYAIVVLVNGVWIALLIGLICLRFRDVQPLVQTAIQIVMLITPIFWTQDALKGHYQF